MKPENLTSTTDETGAVTVGVPLDRARIEMEALCTDIREAARRNADCDSGELYALARELDRIGRAEIAKAIVEGISERRREYDEERAKCENLLDIIRRYEPVTHPSNLDLINLERQVADELSGFCISDRYLLLRAEQRVCG
jgi:hypothetical protein